MTQDDKDIIKSTLFTLTNVVYNMLEKQNGSEPIAVRKNKEELLDALQELFENS